MSADLNGSVARILPGSRYRLIGIDADGADGVALEVAPVEAPHCRVVLFIETPRDWWPQYLHPSADERVEVVDELWGRAASDEDVARSLARGRL